MSVSYPQCSAITLARVVFPIPGGPAIRIILCLDCKYSISFLIGFCCKIPPLLKSLCCWSTTGLNFFRKTISSQLLNHVNISLLTFSSVSRSENLFGLYFSNQRSFLKSFSVLKIYTWFNLIF
jgi:hypothetical protein